MRTEILVGVDKPYRVLIGHGVTADLENEIPETVQQIALLHAPTLKSAAVELAASLSQKVTLHELPYAEKGKTAETLFHSWQVLG